MSILNITKNMGNLSFEKINLSRVNEEDIVQIDD